ncbi:MAG: SDR family oxidoreductase [Ignavibacteria bacterium]|nr:MAG: SDR family oxidoreductase [Ignavibacteria bacterium]
MKGKGYVLITGASKGIGKELANIFARHLYSLILVARSEELLQQMKQEFESKFSIDVKIFVYDLSDSEQAIGLFDEIKKQNLKVDILINNAGFGMYGEFLEIDEKSEQQMIHLNIETLTLLSKLFGREMAKNGGGKILNVASTAAFQPGPGMAVYYATKAYVLSFSEAISYELRPLGIQVSTLCPGPTDTEFHDRAGTRKSVIMQKLNMDAETCASIAYRQFMKGKRLIIPGLMNKIGVFSTRFMPRPWLLWVVYQFMKQKK